MNFCEQLRLLRENESLSEEDASKRFNLPIAQYQNIERGVDDCTFLEKFGLLTGFGMEQAKAFKLAGMADVYKLADMAEALESSHREVRQEDDCLVFYLHDEEVYYVPLSEVTSVKSILRWVLQLSEKSWVTPSMFGSFVKQCSHHLGENPYQTE